VLGIVVIFKLSKLNWSIGKCISIISAIVVISGALFYHWWFLARSDYNKIREKVPKINEREINSAFPRTIDSLKTRQLSITMKA